LSAQFTLSIYDIPRMKNNTGPGTARFEIHLKTLK